MAKTQINNRDWIFQIQTAPTTWADIAELTEFDLNPGENDEEADTTTFEDDGNYREEIMQRGATLDLSGKYSMTAGVRDPGQAACDDLGTKTGTDSVGMIRMRHESETDWTIWECTCRPDSRGGDLNEKTDWEVEFTRCGPATTEAVAP